MKFLTILKSFFRSSRFGRVLTALELLVGLTILFYYADRIIMFRQTTVYYEQFSNLAVYPDDNDAAAAYVEANGTALGKTYSVDLVDDEGLSISNRQAVLGSQAFYRAVPLELFEGEWFEENSTADLIAVVPYALRNDFPCGSIQTIYNRYWGMKTVFISGVLDSNVSFSSFSVSFDDYPYVILLCDPKGNVEVDELSNSYNVALLEKYDRKACLENDIETVGMNNDSKQVQRKTTLAPLLFFTIAVFVLLICGYLGEQFLSLSEKTKSFAVYYMCGASRGLNFTAQFLSDILWLLIPFIAAVVLTFALGIRLRVGVILGSFAFLVAGTAIISLLVLLYVNKKSPVELIRRRFYS